MKNILVFSLFLFSFITFFLITNQQTQAAWQTPTASAPNDAGASTPLNTSATAQTKTGDLLVSGTGGFGNGLGMFGGVFLLGDGSLLNPKFLFDPTNSGSPAWGKVLMSNDTSGTATWVATSTLGLGGGSGGSADAWTRVAPNIYPTTLADSVGIGAVPTAKFSVAQNGNIFNFSGTGSGGYTTGFTMDNTGLKIGHNSNTRDIRLQTGNSSSVATDRVTIKTDSFGAAAVGIGTTNPVADLQVMGGTNPGFTPVASDWAILTTGASSQNRIGAVDSSSGTYIQTAGGVRGEISTWQWPSGPALPLYLNANGGNVVSGGYLLVQAAEPNAKFAVENTTLSGTEFSVDGSANADLVLVRQPATINANANAVDIVGNNHSTPPWAAGAALRVQQTGAAGLAAEFTGRVRVYGNLVADGLSVTGDNGGTKNFRIKHPSKPGKDLVHVSLEGPEVGVYYRGTAELKNGQATITLPDYFEPLTNKEGRTVQLTNIDGGDVIFVRSHNGAQIADGQFIVQSGNKNSKQKFNWEVMASRKVSRPLEVEPVSEGN